MSPEPTAPLLEVAEIHTYYGKSHILDGVSLEVGRGEVVGLLGRNGVGKSTTLKAVAGLVRPSRGEVRFEGRPITRLPGHRVARLGIGYVPEDRRIFRLLTVVENLRTGLDRHGVTAARKKELLEKVYAYFPVLAERRTQAGGTLSGGEQQLLAIARCLCGKPRLVLLDEPTEGIQPSIIDEIVETLQRLRGNSGLTMILVEQNLDFIAALSQRILVIQKGRITQEVKPDDLHQASLMGEFIGINA